MITNIKDYINSINENNNLEHLINNYLSIEFDVDNNKAYGKIYDIEIPHIGAMVPITFVYDITRVYEPVTADSDEDPIFGGDAGSIELEFNQEESILNDEANHYVDMVHEKIQENADKYFEQYSDIRESKINENGSFFIKKNLPHTKYKYAIGNSNSVHGEYRMEVFGMNQKQTAEDLHKILDESGFLEKHPLFSIKIETMDGFEPIK